MATPDWLKKELRANYVEASRAGREAARSEPRAAGAVYVSRDRSLRIELTNGVCVIIPVGLIRGLSRAAPRQIREVEVLGRGGGLHWESLDLDLSVPELIAGVFGGRAWMAELGRVGGRRSSEAKAAAARRNGRKGGRPRLRATGANSTEGMILLANARRQD